MTNRWYDGTGVPSNSLGTKDDYYLQVSKGDLYRKENDIWMRIGNIRGDKGVQGEAGMDGLPGRDGLPGLNGRDGKNGSTWIDGIGIPDSSMGVVNDYYLNIENADIYKKVTDRNWDRIGNIATPEELKRKLHRAIEDDIIYKVDSCIQELKEQIRIIRKEKEELTEQFNLFKQELSSKV